MSDANPRSLADIKRAIRRQVPRRALQPFFERLHGWSLAGMGIGTAVWSVAESGESHFIEMVGAWLAAAEIDAPVLLDVGANTGSYGVLLADHIGTGGRLECFEPAETTFGQLVGAAWTRQPGVGVHRIALGAADGEATLHTRPGHSQLSSLHELDHADAASETVAVRSLDRWAAEAGIEHIHLLKIDVEGAELDVLLGAEGLLSSDAIDIVQFEYGSRNLLGHAALGDFERVLGADFSLHRMVTDGLVPLRPRHGSIEIPMSATNYVAIRRDLTPPFPPHR